MLFSPFSKSVPGFLDFLRSKKLYTKFVLVSLLFSLVIPVVISEVHANAACTAEVKNQIQREIDNLLILETVPTVQERAKIKKTRI